MFTRLFSVKSRLEGLTWGLRTHLKLWALYLTTGLTVEAMQAGPHRIEFDEDTNHG